MDTHVPSLDPDLVVDIVTRSGAVSRREALRKTALYGAALAASPLALAAISKEAYAQTLPAAVQDVLRFALTLEHLEYEFYRDGLATAGLIPASERDILTTIAAHENDHVRFLQSALGLTQGTGAGAAGRPANGFDFTAGGTLPTFTSYPTFLVVSQGLEDTGVRAYKGQAANLIAVDAILQAALQIHSVEARHASAIRRIRGQKGWITANQTDNAAIQATYNGEEATMTVPGGFTAAQISESFDEPLTKDQVLAIAGAFIRP
ncbi:MAG TPA: ferritin-like domain-containing protein [Rubricoccaceae bacterium]|jgi:hypothetical protein